MLGCFFALSFSNGTRVSNLRQNNKCFARDKTESTELEAVWSASGPDRWTSGSSTERGDDPAVRLDPVMIKEK
jgi:hypothetical protein